MNIDSGIYRILIYRALFIVNIMMTPYIYYLSQMDSGAIIFAPKVLSYVALVIMPMIYRDIHIKFNIYTNIEIVLFIVMI